MTAPDLDTLADTFHDLQAVAELEGGTLERGDPEQGYGYWLGRWGWWQGQRTWGAQWCADLAAVARELDGRKLLGAATLRRVGK